MLNNLGDDPEKYPGNKVVLHLGEYEYEGKKKLGIRLKLPGSKPAAKEGTIIPPQKDGASKNPARPASRTDDMDDEIPY